MNFLLTSVFFTVFIAENESDYVFYPTNGTTWSSVTFDIPVKTAEINFWPICRKKSKFYCLSDFRSDKDGVNPTIDFQRFNNFVDRDIYHKILVFKDNAKLASDEAFEQMYRRHNFFVMFKGCCLGQFYSYHEHGLQSLKITPQEYFSNLTDYSEENKKLNLIWSYYLEDCGVNIITKLGFGKGQLKRHHHRRELIFHSVDAPYHLKIGKTWSPAIPYENPETFLTFKWFKNKVMCRDQPWICGKKWWKPWNWITIGYKL